MADGTQDRAAVGGGLPLLGRRGCDFVGAVQTPLAGRDRRLDADLAVEDRETVPLLRGAVEYG